MSIDFDKEEIKLLLIFDELLDEVKSCIDSAYNSFIPFDEEPDPDYTPFHEETIEINIDCCNFYIDVQFRNDGFSIDNVELMDDRDNSIKYEKLSFKLSKHLEAYSKLESRNISSSYNQAREILSDQREICRLNRITSSWVINRDKYKDTIVDLCDKSLSTKEIDCLFQYGTFGRRIKVKASYQKIVDNMITLIDGNIFAPIITDRHKPTQKARFLESIFDGHPYTNYQKGLSNIA